MEISWPPCVTSWRTFSAQLRTTLLDPALGHPRLGSRTPLRRVSWPPGGIGGARAPLRCCGDEGQHDPEQHPTPLSQTSESPGRDGFGISEKKGLIQCWLPSTRGGLSLQPKHRGGPQRAPQGEESAFGSLQTHEESSRY